MSKWLLVVREIWQRNLAAKANMYSDLDYFAKLKLLQSTY